MNQRQRKKKFKKEYGFNPLSKRKIKKWNMFTTAVENLKNVLSKFIKQLGQVSSILEERIRSMPEEEFEKKLQELTLEQQVLAIRIRRGQ